MPYRVLFVLAVLLGTQAKLDFVWTLADTFNGMMAIPNLIGLIMLSPVIVRETQDYFSRREAMKAEAQRNKK
jgi:AGCS family alanine or glycine:cation symporter